MRSACFLLLIGIFCFLSCSESKTKDKFHKKINMPDYSFKKLEIDQFYYLTYETGTTTSTIPLIKPYTLYKTLSSNEWFLDTDLGNIYNELGGGISPVINFNVYSNFIYGYKSKLTDENISDFIMPEKWFIINIEKKKLIYFDKESDFLNELRKLKLPEKFLTPDEVYEQYRNDPVLPWFPEDIKKQLEEAKAKHEK